MNVPKMNGIWNWEKHTKQEKTKCYGVLAESNSPVCFEIVR